MGFQERYLHKQLSSRERIEERLPETAAELLPEKHPTKFADDRWHLWTQKDGPKQGKIVNVFPVEENGAMRVKLANTKSADTVALLATEVVRLYDDSAILSNVELNELQTYDYVYLNQDDEEPVLITQIVRNWTPDGTVAIRFEDENKTSPLVYDPKDESRTFTVIRIPNLASAFGRRR